LVCMDARQFEFPAGPLLVFLFNPLPERALAVVIGNLESAIRGQPRPAYVVYHNPLLEHVLAKSGALSKAGGNMQWAVHTNDREAANAPHGSHGPEN
jgi:hypothetical protein